MMPYGVEVTSSARRDLEGLDDTVRQRVTARIRFLAAQVESHRHHALKGRWQGSFRLRVGDHRVIYRLEHASRTLTVLQVGHRSSIYE